MKLVNRCLLVWAVTAAAPAFGLEKLDAWDVYQRHLLAKHVAGDDAAAAKTLEEARKETREQASDLAGFVNESANGSPQTDNPKLKLAIQFLTGRKQEVYCKGVGLVEIKGQHKDGTESHVVLKAQRREMGDDYAWVKDGAWAYELVDGYRSAASSELWMVASSDNSYRLKERRDRQGGGDSDTGDYSVDWSADGSHLGQHVHTHGESLEPFPMYMANDFHLWGGNATLGRSLVFRVGYEKNRSGIAEHGFGYKILLRSKQTVALHLPEASVVDNSGRAITYADCFQVDYDIQFEGLVKE